ncbi:hypothetical protein Nocox_35975 [Nonomuraea coxensis DSM 45129]|uniref:Uncharacterized protein n=1 Tax=Nonomuraea coxensis DSM 45129 TaxID=1122611 RepID=A0ABX8UD91_9ACTN|nr:hypothetical protein [Nonomuraea coxensis]QYC44754.1 hypothetical protein Nocox_35975 [Nonomuraea coxensis DSM 45129]
MSPTPPGKGPLDPRLSGIDPALMDAFIAAMTRAHAQLGGQAQAIREALARVGVGAAALAPIKEIEDWAGDQLPRLRVRNELIRRRMPEWLPGWAGPGLTRYDEAEVPFASPEEARRAGADLARRYRAFTEATTGKVVTDEVKRQRRDLLAELLAHRDDADHAAAFFGGLGTAATQALPAEIDDFFARGDHLPVSDRAASREQALAELSTMFGTAASAASRVPGMAKVMADLQRGGEGVDQVALSWLVYAGRFPAAWLAAVGRANVVMPMLSGTLKPETVASGATRRFLDALAADPAAARLAIGSVSRDWPDGAARPPFPSPLILPKPTMAAVLSGMDRFLARVELRGDPGEFRRTRESFAGLLAAGSGVRDERDGEHSQDASRFAFAVITAAPRFSLTDSMRGRLGEIGGSYATEITAAARSLDPDAARPSKFGAYDDELFGTEPAFRLSLTDAYRFVQTFADTDAHMEPFDRGMAALTQRLFAEGVRADRAQLADPPPGGLQPETAVERLFSRLGMVSGLQFAAMKAVRGTADLHDRAGYDAFGKTLDKGMDGAMLFLPAAGGMPAAVGWMVLSWAVKDGLGAALEPDARLPAVNERELARSRAVLYDLASGLVARGYTAKGAPVSYRPPTDPLIVDAAGHLRPAAEIHRDPKKTEAFLRWLKANGAVVDDADRRSLGKLVESSLLKFSGAQDQTQKILAGQDPALKKILTGDD